MIIYCWVADNRGLHPPSKPLKSVITTDISPIGVGFKIK